MQHILSLRSSEETVAKLDEALDKLRMTVAGGSIAEVIENKGTRLRFGETSGGAVAQYDSQSNEIIVNAQCRVLPVNVLAAYLAHEGIHVLWDEPNSIEQEYQAFRAEAAVWEELKGEETDRQCDLVTAMISRGERMAKLEIAFLYPELPEHRPGRR